MPIWFFLLPKIIMYNRKWIRIEPMYSILLYLWYVVQLYIILPIHEKYISFILAYPSNHITIVFAIFNNWLSGFLIFLLCFRKFCFFFLCIGHEQANYKKRKIYIRINKFNLLICKLIRYIVCRFYNRILKKLTPMILY